jgi:hypothetical protein
MAPKFGAVRPNHSYQREIKRVYYYYYYAKVYKKLGLAICLTALP